MATGGERRIYKENDYVDEPLLNQLSKWILYHRLGMLARDLGISHAEFSRIAVATSSPDEQIFKILLKWHNKRLVTVKGLIQQMVNWTDNNYVDREMWKHFSTIIHPSALPVNIGNLQLPAPPTGGNPLQQAVMEAVEQATGLPRYPCTSQLVSEMPQATPLIEPMNQGTLQMGTGSGTAYIVEEPIYVRAGQSPSYPSPTFPAQQYTASFSQGQPSENYLLASQPYAESHPTGRQNGGLFYGQHPAGFFTENQAAEGQIHAESITAAYISAGISTVNNPPGGSVRARQICAAFINSGQESGHQTSAGSITAGKLSADSITSSTGPITAGELRIEGSIGSARTSAESAEQDLSDPPQGKGDQY